MILNKVELKLKFNWLSIYYIGNYALYMPAFFFFQVHRITDIVVLNTCNNLTM